MDDTKKLILAAVVVVILVVGLFIGSRSGQVPLPNQISTQKNVTPTVSETKTTAKEVTIENYSYNPSNLIVKVGDTITWVNKDSVAHTATSDDDVFDTGLIDPGEKSSITLTTPGTYTYHCTPHPMMKGTIIVE